MNERCVIKNAPLFFIIKIYSREIIGWRLISVVQRKTITTGSPKQVLSRKIMKKEKM